MKELKKELAKYIAANVCGMIGLSCYILADTFFIAIAMGQGGLTALIWHYRFTVWFMGAA